MKVVFTGPPFSGKDTQARLLGEKLQIPVFSMGQLIRNAYEEKDPDAIKGFEEYSMKGKHLPNSLKFKFLREQLERAPNGYIIDNFPATQEDLDTLNVYLTEKSTTIDRVFLLSISEETMNKRMVNRGRDDDDPEVLKKRRIQQDEDRMAVIAYYKEKGILTEINGEQTVEAIHDQILKAIRND